MVKRQWKVQSGPESEVDSDIDIENINMADNLGNTGDSVQGAHLLSTQLKN